MEIAKLTSKGQVTIPKRIREALDLNSGSNLLFIQEGGRIYIMNASIDEISQSHPDSIKIIKEAFSK